MLFIACAPCRIVATPGRQLGVNDTSAYVDVTHRNEIDTANPLLGAFFADATGLRPFALRADWAPSEHRIHVVVGLLDDECWVSDSHPQTPKIRWLALDQMRKLDTSLHDTAAIALASYTSLQAQK